MQPRKGDWKSNAPLPTGSRPCAGPGPLLNRREQLLELLGDDAVTFTRG